MAEEAEKPEVTYIEVYPVIITNYLRAKGKKPGFVQIQATIAVYGEAANKAVEKHQPLIRDTIISFLSFTEEAVIKDISKRQELRQNLMDKVNAQLEEVLGYPYAEDLIITHFMWN